MKTNHKNIKTVSASSALRIAGVAAVIHAGVPGPAEPTSWLRKPAVSVAAPVLAGVLSNHSGLVGVGVCGQLVWERNQLESGQIVRRFKYRQKYC